MAKDCSEAMYWSRLAAKQGHPGGQVSLGLMYARGDGVSQDGDEAVRWFRAAADQGDSRGQLNLAMAYWAGMGVARDPIEAYLWATISASQRNEEARSFKRPFEGDDPCTMVTSQATRAGLEGQNAGTAEAQAASRAALIGFTTSERLPTPPLTTGLTMNSDIIPLVKWGRPSSDQGRNRPTHSGPG